ncbi:hypothetical protein LSM04_001238 [Trypanosoma melophagium]|uniref:uncharacterized protein n=1 Tax=Trypanosoma melophagium TaxID=715481 RepID=UPI00351A6F61|nr:hypothetical protein LSM04_001238 [Trypanosoma melophagium]
MNRNHKTRFPAILLILPLILLIWIECPAVAQTSGSNKYHTYAIFNFSSDPVESITRTASKLCENEGMQLAMPNSLAKATSMEGVIGECVPRSARILFGGHGLSCPTYTPIYFFVPSFNFTTYPVQGSTEQCDALIGSGVEKVCSINNASLGTPFYRFDNDTKDRDCNGPIGLDYDPVERYQFKRPSTESFPLLGWNLMEDSNGTRTLTWENICSGDVVTCNGTGTYSTTQYVMCESDDSVGSLSTSCVYTERASRSTTTMRNDLWIIIGLAGSFLVLVLLFLLIAIHCSIHTRHDEKVARKESLRHFAYSASQQGSFREGNTSSRGSFDRRSSAAGGSFYGSRSIRRVPSGNLSRQGSFNGNLSRQGSFNGNMQRQGSFNGNMQRQGSFNGNMQRQGSFNGNMQRQGSFNGNPLQQGSFNGNMQRQGSFNGNMQRQGSFNGNMQRQGSFNGNMQRQGSFNGNPLQQGSFNGNMQRQGSFNGNMQRQGSFYGNRATPQRASSHTRMRY